MAATKYAGLTRGLTASGKLNNWRVTRPISVTRHFRTTIPRSESPPGSIPLKTSSNPLPQIKPVALSRDALLRLHKLSALNPPAEGSDEEQQLVEGLGELVGLMELVKDVELEGDVGDLLAEGVGEVVIDGSDTPETRQGTENTLRGEEKSGKELLGWATRRVGDFYAHRLERKP